MGGAKGEGRGPKGWGPKHRRRVGARKGGGQKGGGPKISRFFFSSPAARFVLFFPLWGLLVEFWWCLKRRGAQMCTFGVLGLSCASPGGPSVAGSHFSVKRAKRREGVDSALFGTMRTALPSIDDWVIQCHALTTRGSGRAAKRRR